MATVRHYATDKFFQSKGVYLCIATGGSNSAYRSAIKSVVVTAGDIVNDYN